MINRLLVSAALLAGAGTPAMAADVGSITPRTPLPKLPAEKLVIPRDATGRITANGRLLVKFHDSVRARAPITAAPRVSAQSDEDLRGVDEILARHGLTARQALAGSLDRLTALEAKAAQRSRRAQPDLAGMIFVEGPLEVLELAAPQINALPIVEFVEFEQEMITHRAPTPAPRGGGEEPSCTNSMNDCFVANDGPFCDDFACCTLVGAIIPNCVDLDFGSWDVFCADVANLLCQDGDRCLTPLTNGGCYEAHPTPGCNAEACCNTVCEIQPFCCLVIWDETCAITASLECGNEGPDMPTPDFSMTSAVAENRLQKYTTYPPEGPGGAFFDRFGFTGDGLDLDSLELLGQILHDDYGVGEGNWARGETVKVGVVEHSAFVTGPKVAEGGERWHEDLEDVIPEANQTIITVFGGNLNPDHGTSTLGQIVGAHNGFGVSGIARDAQGYFFPIVSAEEGGRTLNAMLSAIELFDPGDVLNYSIGPGGGGTLVSNAGPWTIVRLGSDLGITSCISAGNDCFNLDDGDGPQFGGEDSGAIIVGACWPGAPIPPAPGVGRFCRLGFSNHCRDCEADSLVHTSAWGILVTTTGGGDLFAVPNAAGNGMNKARAYTAFFNGTSAAAPIVAGLATCLQGLAKQFYGVPIPPESLRGLISDTGTPQCDIVVPANIPGSPTDGVCAGDFDPDEEPRLIGGFPLAYEAGIGVITGNYFSASPVTGMKVVTGTLLGGNQISLKAIDGSTVSIRTVNKAPGSQGVGTPPAITYIAGGQTTDMEVSAYTGILAGEATGIGVQVISQASAQYVIMAVYLYDWPNARWTLIPQFEISPNGVFVYQGANFINPGFNLSPEGVVYVRIWTCGLGNVPQHVVNHDFVDVLVSDVPGFDPFGGGEGGGGGGGG